MSSDIFDRIAASVPQDATAARVTSRGEVYNPTIEYAGHFHADSPPPTRPIPAASMVTCGHLPGAKFGRFTVVGQISARGGSFAVHAGITSIEVRRPSKTLRILKIGAGIALISFW